MQEENSTDFTGLGTEAVLTLEVGIFDLEVGLLDLSILTSIVLAEKSGQFHNENVIAEDRFHIFNCQLQIL